MKNLVFLILLIPSIAFGGAAIMGEAGLSDDSSGYFFEATFNTADGWEDCDTFYFTEFSDIEGSIVSDTCQFTASADNDQYTLRTELPSSYDEFTAEVEFKMDDATISSNTAGFIQWIQFRDSLDAETVRAVLQAKNPCSTPGPPCNFERLYVYYQDDAGSKSSNTTITGGAVSADTYYTIRLYYKISDGGDNGALTLWFDDVEEIALTGLDNDTIGDTDEVNVHVVNAGNLVSNGVVFNVNYTWGIDSYLAP